MPEMSTGASFLYSLLGIAIVMVVLAALAGVIMLVSLLTKNMRAKRQTDKPTEPEAVSEAVPHAASAPAAEYPAATAGTLKLKHTDDRTAALIMAIISDQTSIPLNQLRFKSIVCLNP